MVAVRSGKCLLRKRLKDASLSQAELARRLQMPVSQVSDWANNRKTMGLDNAKNIADILSIPMDSLYEWEEVRLSDRKRKREQD